MLKVVINDVEYIPKPAVVTTDRHLAALEVELDDNDADARTVRDYLHVLLHTLWEQKHAFNSKRPFGNSFWESTMVVPLIRAGYIKGELDKDGYLKSEEDADEFISGLISVMCKRPQ